MAAEQQRRVGESEQLPDPRREEEIIECILKKNSTKPKLHKILLRFSALVSFDRLAAHPKQNPQDPPFTSVTLPHQPQPSYAFFPSLLPQISRRVHVPLLEAGH